jgi:hypothetical protein
MSLRPSHLPKVRDQTLGFLDDPAASIRAKTGADIQPGLDAAANHLRTAGLYWVAPDMAALAMHSGGQLAAARWAQADRPSPSGLMAFEGGVGAIEDQGVTIPVEAISWGPYDGGLMLWAWLTRTRLAAEALASSGAQIVTEGVPPLMPTAAVDLPVTADPIPLANYDGIIPEAIVRTVAASWLLMRQPTLIETRTEQADKAVRRAYGRQGRPAPDVTLVELRHQYVPHGEDADEGAEPGRHYKHRFVVAGHWRTYRHERYSTERRAEQQYIPHHWKGPDGAPLLITEKVNVWRR